MNKETFLAKVKEARDALYDVQLAIETGDIRIEEPTTLAHPVEIAGYPDADD